VDRSERDLNLSIDPVLVPAPLFESRYGPDPVVRHLALALRGELADGCPGGRLLADGVRAALAAHLSGAADRRPAAGERRLTRAELARIHDRIHADLTDDLRLADLAAAVPLSPYHFSRVFKATTGLTPHRYVMRCRAEAARALLARDRVPLAEVARRTGFADAAHLTRQFRRQFGVTPGAFRAAAVR
jgi:AraC family transcriptional regulator